MKTFKITLVLLLSITAMSLISCDKEGRCFLKDQYIESQIFSLKNKSNIEGNFILGIGSIGGVEYYMFYRKLADGGLFREQIKVDECVLYEYNGKPKVLYPYAVYGIYEDDVLVKKEYRKFVYNHEYMLPKIYIPKGTITEKLNQTDLN